MTEFNYDETNILLEAVYDERRSQFRQWGDQHHASAYSENELRRFAKSADTWKQINDARAEAGTLTWDGILIEEVMEALSETEPTLRVIELIQVAAVALAEAESINRLLDELDAEEPAVDEEAA
jgi:hypothetical protein